MSFTICLTFVHSIETNQEKDSMAQIINNWNENT